MPRLWIESEWSSCHPPSVFRTWSKQKKMMRNPISCPRDFRSILTLRTSKVLSAPYSIPQATPRTKNTSPCHRYSIKCNWLSQCFCKCAFVTHNVIQTMLTGVWNDKRRPSLTSQFAKKKTYQYGRLYAQLDQPRKVRFGINAVEVYGLVNSRKRMREILS